MRAFFVVGVERGTGVLLGEVVAPAEVVGPAEVVCGTAVVVGAGAVDDVVVQLVSRAATASPPATRHR